MERQTTIKRILLATNAICLAVIVWLLFQKGPTPGPTPIPERVPNCTLCGDYSNFTPSELPATLVKDMVTNYRTNQLNSITSSSSTPMTQDAHSIWFNLDTLKKFIYHIEKNVQNNNAASSAKLGLRVYYAAYPAGTMFGGPGYEALSTLDHQYGKMHTLVMLPTILYGGHYQDFNPKDLNTYKGFNSLPSWNNGGMEDVTAMVLTGQLSRSAGGDNGDVGAQNHGQLIPPGDPSGEGF